MYLLCTKTFTMLHDQRESFTEGLVYDVQISSARHYRVLDNDGDWHHMGEDHMNDAFSLENLAPNIEVVGSER